MRLMKKMGVVYQFNRVSDSPKPEPAFRPAYSGLYRPAYLRERLNFGGPEKGARTMNNLWKRCASKSYSRTGGRARPQFVRNLDMVEKWWPPHIFLYIDNKGGWGWSEFWNFVGLGWSDWAETWPGGFFGAADSNLGLKLVEFEIWKFSKFSKGYPLMVWNSKICFGQKTGF